LHLPETFDTKAVHSNHAGKQGIQEYQEFREGSRLVPLIGYLDSDEAKSVLLESLNANNLQVRLAAALVVAGKWPENLLQISQGKFSDDEYVKIMAYAALKHPELMNRLRSKVAEKAFEEAFRDLNQSGALIVFPTDTVLSN
jgi:hypothetical protein